MRLQDIAYAEKWSKKKYHCLGCGYRGKLAVSTQGYYHSTDEFCPKCRNVKDAGPNKFGRF